MTPSSTAATASSLLSHSTVCSVAFSGLIRTPSAVRSPAYRVRLSRLSSTLSTGTSAHTSLSWSSRVSAVFVW